MIFSAHSENMLVISSDIHSENFVKEKLMCRYFSDLLESFILFKFILLELLVHSQKLKYK